LTRVLFLTESFHPVLGGGEQHIRALATSFAASGVPATVLTRRSERSLPLEERLEGVRVLRVPPSGPGRRGKYAMVPFVLSALREEAATFDVVVVRGTRVLGLPGLVMGRILGKGIILQPELNGEMSGEVYTFGTPLDRPVLRSLVARSAALRNALLRDADAFVAMSHAIREEFLTAGVPQEKVAHIPHGIDTHRFRPATAAERLGLRRVLGLPLTPCLVTYTGRLLAGKGLETLIEAFSHVARECDAHLLLVGSGGGQALSVEEELKEQARGLGVTFTGRTERVEEYLRASDVFAFPSVYEALGLSLIEAASCGLACVGSRTGGIVDVIEDGRSGLLVAPKDAREWALALKALVQSAERRSALGARGREVALSRFDARDSLDSYRALFHEVANRRTSATA
jgi:glycosyltransferase involved in cell wall biosynthesis